MTDTNIVLFKEWLAENGASFPKINWPSDDTESGVRGAVATEDIEVNAQTGEYIMEIPAKLMMSPPIAYSDPDIGTLLRSNRDILRGDVTLAVFVMSELSKGDNSFYAPFLRILPQPGSICQWKSSDLQFLQDDSLRVRSKRRIESIESTYRSSVMKLNERHPNEFPLEEFTLERYKFAWYCIQSRAFGRRLPWTALVPMADCLNHSNVPTKYDYNKNGNGLFRLFPSNTNRYSKGTEVFNSYGRRGNDNLLMEYGFALLDNEWDEVAIDITHITTTKVSCDHNNISNSNSLSEMKAKEDNIEDNKEDKKEDKKEGDNNDDDAKDDVEEESSTTKKKNYNAVTKDKDNLYVPLKQTMVATLSSREVLPLGALSSCRSAVAPFSARTLISKLEAESTTTSTTTSTSTTCPSSSLSSSSSRTFFDGKEIPSQNHLPERLKIELDAISLLLTSIDLWIKNHPTTLIEDEHILQVFNDTLQHDEKRKILLELLSDNNLLEKDEMLENLEKEEDFREGKEAYGEDSSSSIHVLEGSDLNKDKYTTTATTTATTITETEIDSLHFETNTATSEGLKDDDMSTFDNADLCRAQLYLLRLF
eukprot:gene9408-19522_t